MDGSENSAGPVTLCAGAVVVDAAGRLLAVLRRNEPSSGCWSVPGGRVEPGESLAEAARREVAEETGLEVEIGAHLGVTTQDYVDAGGRARTLQIHDFAAVVTGGSLAAGDDALDAQWLSRAQLAAAPLTPELLAIIDGFGVAVR
ncbi:MAG: 8-oxo-dGTP diphosphatase [Frankiaceae bacterium]|nr:8-oxo-dGTP diphosphatase [Frankiaceae bacterium]